MNYEDKSIRILAIDDSHVVRDMVYSELINLGYNHIDLAEDGVEALEMAKENEYDFILTDINMPNMNGFDLIMNLRNMLDYIDVPIMVLTTEYSDDMKEKGLSVGATSWIVKPLKTDTLETAIPRTIRKSQE
jgi:two-component system, chemotaxis family, chemotaxis protein CheY